MKIFDCFIFCDEWEMLDLRFHELKGLDVTHVIVESPWTHSGLPKPLNLKERLAEYFGVNIIHVAAEDIISGGTARENETLQRNAILKGLIGAADDDIVIISDADEIPRREAVISYKKEMGLTSLKMDFYYYWLNCLTEKGGWDMAKIMTYGYLRDHTPDEVRTSGYPSIIENGGWHFSWQGGIEKVMAKFKNFSHQEEAVQKHADYEKVKQKIETGQSLFGDEYWPFVEIDATFPRAIIGHKERFANMIKETGPVIINKFLAGTLFVHNGLSQDYSYHAAIESLQALCDHVIVVDAGSNDGTYEDILTLKNDKTTIIRLTYEDWVNQRGREKLNYFTNVAIERAQEMGFEWQINLQADEVIHEDSFPYIRKAIELDEEAYLVTRINLWGSPYTMLNVPQRRKPVSTQICRLTKTNYRSVGDAESIGAPACPDFINKINFFHTGFVRDRVKHIQKIKHIQRDVFLIDYDKRADISDTFNPWQWGFDRSDVVPIEGTLPKFVEQWAKQRDYDE